MMEKTCTRHKELLEEAQRILETIHEISAKQVDTIEGGVSERFMSRDRKLELAMGAKERAIGALREHDEEHGCQRV